MSDLTLFEQQAMKETLKPLGEYVAHVGIDKPLANYSTKEIQHLVETIITAFQDIMQKEETYTKDKELPF